MISHQSNPQQHTHARTNALIHSLHSLYALHLSWPLSEYIYFLALHISYFSIYFFLIYYHFLIFASVCASLPFITQCQIQNRKYSVHRKPPLTYFPTCLHTVLLILDFGFSREQRTDTLKFCLKPKINTNVIVSWWISCSMITAKIKKSWSWFLGLQISFHQHPSKYNILLQITNIVSINLSLERSLAAVQACLEVPTYFHLLYVTLCSKWAIYTFGSASVLEHYCKKMKQSIII